MLTLINTLSLATALTLQPITNEINVQVETSGTSFSINSNSTLQKEEKYEDAYLIVFLDNEQNEVGSGTLTNYKAQTNTNVQESKTKIAIGYRDNTYDISKYEELNEITTLQYSKLYTSSIQEYKGESTYTFTINIRSTTFMEELLTALTTAVQSAVSIFVEGFGGLTQIFYNGTEITFIGGILIVGLAVMFLMMFLRWIVSFVKGI